MALGFPTTSGGGGDFLPICKYDARAGRTFRIDQVGTEKVPTEIQFKAVLDMENIEVGWLFFAAGVAPDLRLVKLGDPWPDQPSPDYKRGVRVVGKLAKEVGGDIREICSNSMSFVRGFDALHTAYEAGKGANPGKLPVVVIEKTVPVTSKGGGQSSTNYEPVFKIVSWVDRPQDLKPNLRGGGGSPAMTTPAAAAPSTGSTAVPPPFVPNDADEFA